MTDHRGVAGFARWPESHGRRLRAQDATKVLDDLADHAKTPRKIVGNILALNSATGRARVSDLEVPPFLVVSGQTSSELVDEE
jgi:hypothetical protein